MLSSRLAAVFACALIACSGNGATPAEQPSTVAAHTTAAQDTSSVSAASAPEPFVLCQHGKCVLNFSATGAAREVRVARCPNPAPECAANLGRLTADGVARAQALAAQLSAAKLEPSYGCPGCVDGAIHQVVLHGADGKTSQHTYDAELDGPELPESLRKTSAFLRELQATVHTCKSGTLVEVATPCTPPAL